MFFKTKILEILSKNYTRFFKCKVLSNQLHHFTQYNSGGDDYCPLVNAEALGGTINNNPAHGFVFAWKDCTERKTAPGEKRIFATNADGSPVAEVHLKNDGTINIIGGDVVINVPQDSGSISINGNNVAINVPQDGGSVSISGGSAVINVPEGVATINAATVNLGGSGGAFVLTENTEIMDGENRPCTITSNTTKTKAV